MCLLALSDDERAQKSMPKSVELKNRKKKRGSLSETKGGGYCPPDQGYSIDQARLIVQKFLKENPQALHQ
jgi:hypothetical protein